MLEWQEVRRRRGIAAFVTGMAALALLAPIRPAVTPETSIGLLLGLDAILEWLHGQRRPTLPERMGAWREGAVTLVMAVLLLSAPLLSGDALVIFFAASFISEGIRRLTRLWSRRDPTRYRRRILIGSLDIAAGVGMLLLLRAHAAVRWTVAIAAALRLLESACDDDGAIRPFEGDTAIFITPGYRFRAIDGLMTNFHLPRSTLFMLVSALMGLERMQAVYAHAIREGYRFYSYGDSSLLLPNP